MEDLRYFGLSLATRLSAAGNAVVLKMLGKMTR
jgi:hypothetical protein